MRDETLTSIVAGSDFSLPPFCVLGGALAWSEAISTEPLIMSIVAGILPLERGWWSVNLHKFHLWFCGHAGVVIEPTSEEVGIRRHLTL